MADAASRTFTTEAKALADAGQFGEAIKVLQQGLNSFPKMMSARVLMGEVYWLSGNASLARVELEQVLKTTPDNFAAHRKLALIYRDLGDLHAAVQSCEVVLQANPKDREMKDLLEELGGATVAPTQAPSVSVRPSESPATVIPPKAEETDSETLAELYIAQGHRDRGLAVYRRLVAQAPDNMAFHERIMELEVDVPGEETEWQETPTQTARKVRIRRLEGWLAVIRERRQA